MMKILSAIFSGFVLFKPVMEVKSIYEHKTRTLGAILAGGAAFTFFMTALILATVEMVLQYDAQGFILWSVMLTLSMLFLAFALAAAFVATAIFPKPEIVVAPQLQDVLHKVLLGLANQFPEEAATREQAREMSEVAAEREKIRTHPRGDLELDQMPAPAFTH